MKAKILTREEREREIKNRETRCRLYVEYGGAEDGREASSTRRAFLSEIIT